MPDDIEQFRCRPESLPRYLYRVQYRGCNTSYDGHGLSAADESVFPVQFSRSEFRASIERQFLWENRQPTRYISLFSDRKHAARWALKIHSNVELLRISTASLDNLVIFKLSTLVEELRAEIQGAAKQHVAGAYVCVHHIPSHAIDDSMDEGGIERSVFAM
jgi:hypothetical protein